MLRPPLSLGLQTVREIFVYCSFPRFPAYLTPIHVLYIMAFGPLWNISFLFLTWYQSLG
jgi:hypothetical protein